MFSNKGSMENMETSQNIRTEEFEPTVTSSVFWQLSHATNRGHAQTEDYPRTYSLL